VLKNRLRIYADKDIVVKMDYPEKGHNDSSYWALPEYASFDLLEERLQEVQAA
jgi:hypothetical protein